MPPDEKIAISLKFGHGHLSAQIDSTRLGGWLLPQTAQDLPGEVETIQAALDQPIGTPRLRDLLSPGQRVTIVTSDITRPCPSKILLPPVLKELEEAGILTKDITIVLALGIHRQHTQAEKEALVGSDILKNFKVIDHDPNKCLNLGTTSRGTPIDVFDEVARADKRVLLGNVEYHYFAGFSGGAKAILPGVSSPRAIKNNHRLMTQPLARAGILTGNPVRADIDELPNHLSVDFILNVVLGEDKKVRAAFAGHHLKAHRAACHKLDEMFQTHLPAPGADVVLVSAGGYPKDINVYQAQKALDNAAQAVRPNGTIIWVGACDEGYGEKTFERWLREAKSPQDLILRANQNFELGGHKAAAIALVLERCDVLFVSNLSPQMASSLFVTPANDLTLALNQAFERLGPESKVFIMPYGGSTLPKIDP
ncbi:MAG: nickel-dependent lactate racemase [Deltaproteobacteria bacterium]|nr:nickel-dependent lactate racemase [Deltaproteobacteria bacterium]